MTHLFSNFAKNISYFFRINQKFDIIPRNNTKIDFIEEIVINCSLLVEK